MGRHGGWSVPSVRPETQVSCLERPKELEGLLGQYEGRGLLARGTQSKAGLGGGHHTVLLEWGVVTSLQKVRAILLDPFGLQQGN